MACCYDQYSDNHYLFSSERDPNKPIDRIQAWRILKRGYRACGMRGKLSTHSMRKTYANRVYKTLMKKASDGYEVDALRTTSKLLGHTLVSTTDAYLSFLDSDFDDVIEEETVSLSSVTVK